MKLASAADFNQVEEYESDSEISDVDTDSDSEDLIIGKPVVTRSGRQVKVWTRFDVYAKKGYPRQARLYIEGF